MNKCFSDYELTCRVENERRNTSESNTGDLWKILNKFKKREDKIDIDELYEYFKNLNLSNEVGDSNFEMPDNNDNLANDTLNGKIIEEEITSIIQNLKNGKAPGYDCVINEYIKSTISLCMPLYLKLLRKIIDTGIMYRVQLVRVEFELTTLVVIGTDCTGSCKSNYQTITTMTALQVYILYDYELYIVFSMLPIYRLYSCIMQPSY